MDPLTVRRSTPDEWRQARDLRREMLADTPMAYTSTLDEALAMTDEQWQRRHRERFEAPDLMATFVAVDDDGRWRGQVGVVVAPWPAPARVWVGAVYLGPEARGRGTADALMAAAEEWALEHGHDRVWLQVHEHNDRARAFYRRLGWVETGRRDPYPLDPDAEDVEMGKDLRRG